MAPLVTRILLIVCLLPLLSSPLQANEAMTQLSVASPLLPEAGSSTYGQAAVSRVVVIKSLRLMQLKSGEEVIRSYRISLGDNPEGHKLFEGDQRTPEGLYVLDWRNPGSDFYKSIHISYPNEHDAEMARIWGQDPGGNIMIHGLPNSVGDMAFAYEGLDWTDGCIAVNNEAMDEIWKMVPDGTLIEIRP